MVKITPVSSGTAGWAASPMSDQTAVILVQYWMEKSNEAFESATVLFEHHQYAACINRLYYAAFYAFGAALAQRGLSYGKHSAVRASMHRDFVKVGLLAPDSGMIYNRLFEWRQKADYEVLLKVDEIMARDLYKQTETLLSELKKLSGV